jgi:hypothetical protein
VTEDPSAPLLSAAHAQTGAPVAPESASQAEPETFDFDELRRLLLGQEQDSLAHLSGDLGELQRLMADKDALAAIIAPSLDAALRDKIQQNRDEMIEVLYPIIGQTVLRAVGEAIQDLARTVDARVRTTMTPQAVWRRIRAQVTGVSGAELALRDALPFEVTEVFLIHRASGLLLRHVTPDGQAPPDRDLVSGMLTAIRDFVADAFGRGQQSELEAIQYSGQHILIEAAEHVYLAAVVQGIEPAGFRSALRDLAIEIENRYRYLLHSYQGDASAFAALDLALGSLAGDAPASAGSRLTHRQKGALAGAAALVGACLLAFCLGGWALVRAANRPLPTPAVVYIVAATATPSLIPTATATWTPSPSATPTATPANTATATATPTPSPTATAEVVVAGVRANVRAGPGLEFPIKTVADPGALYAVTGLSSDLVWVQICCLSDGTTGWIAAAFTSPAGATPSATPP